MVGCFALFHLVIETPNANPVARMRWLLSTYTIRLDEEGLVVLADALWKRG